MHWSGKLALVYFFACFFLTLGKTKERIGDNETAIQLYGKAIEYCPENALVRYRRGKLLIGMKRYKVERFFFVLGTFRYSPTLSLRFKIWNS